MNKKLFIIGTDTDVGKTFITAGITYLLRENRLNSISFKPVQSGGVIKNNNIIPQDVQFVKEIAKIEEPYDTMNSYCFRDAVSPHLASERENIPININKIKKDFEKLKKKFEYIVIEGAGGTIVPIIRNKYYMYNLIKDFNAPVVIVAKAQIGTINHTILTVNFLKNLGIKIKGIIINNYTNKFYEDDNINIIEELTGINVITKINHLELKNNSTDIEKIREEFNKQFTFNQIKNLFD